MKIFPLLVMVLMLCGCQTQIPRGAHLSRAQAVAIARQTAIERGEKLDDYKSPEADFDPKSDRWHISFHSKQAYTYTFTSVIVDDMTGKAIAYDSSGWK